MQNAKRKQAKILPFVPPNQGVNFVSILNQGTTIDDATSHSDDCHLTSTQKQWTIRDLVRLTGRKEFRFQDLQLHELGLQADDLVDDEQDSGHDDEHPEARRL